MTEKVFKAGGHLNEREADVSAPERRLGLVHRVVAAHHGMNEYAILITDKRSLFIRRTRSQGGFALRAEILSGSPPKANAPPETLEDYSGAAIGSLESDEGNVSVPHESVTKLVIGVGGLFPVYHFDLEYRSEERRVSLVFYAVPLSTYGQTGVQRPREEILREYAQSILALYRQVLSGDTIDDIGLSR